MTSTAALFAERSAHWTRQGLVGRPLYLALAADSELPDNFRQEDVAEILHIDEGSVKQRRARGEEPSFLRVSGKIVLYPRNLFCMWLASTLVDRRSPEAIPASDRYTQAHRPKGAPYAEQITEN